MNQYFKWVLTEGGLKQFTIIKSLAVCSEAGSERDNVDSLR
jgi:hypothetical protein